MKQALCVAVMILAAMSLHAQQSSETKQNANSNANEIKDQKTAEPYRFVLVVRETKEGKVVNSRSYSWMEQVGNQKSESTIKVGDRVPIAVAAINTEKNVAPLSTQYQYIDVGTNIRCTAHIEGEEISLDMRIDLSSVLEGQTGTGSGLYNLPPVVTQTLSDIQPVLHIGKPTTIFSLDDPMSKGHLEGELTVTKLKE